MKIPTVSIIVPNYNHKSFLKLRLDSIFSQTFQDFELILLDDASIDGSHEILESYRNHPKVTHLIINKQNSGSPFKQWKKGLNLSKGIYVWIAESDDYSEPLFLEHLLKRMNDNIDICYSQSIDVDENGIIISKRINYTKNFNPNIWNDGFEISGLEFAEKYLLVKNVIPNASAVIFKRELIKDVFFSEKLLSMKMCGDWFFWLQLCKNSNIKFVAESLNYFRSHSAISRKHDTVIKRKMRLQEEVDMRQFVFDKLNLINKNQNEILLKKWFELHSFKSIFTISFYNFQKPFGNKFSLLLKFVSFKLKM